MELGARFVCTKCRLRGPARVCPGCAQERLDFTAPEGLEALRRGWPMFPAWERGLSFLSPRSIPLNRRVVRLALAATACVALGPVIAAATGREGHVGGIGLALAVSLVASPLLAAFFAVFLFYYAHVYRLLFMLLGLLAMLPLLRRPLTVIAWLVRVPAAWLLPSIELDEAPEPRVALEGRLATGFALHTLRDGLGWMDRADAWADPFEVDSAGQRLRVDPRAGSIVLAYSFHRDFGAEDVGGRGPYRDAPGAPEATIPPWVDGRGRSAPTRHRIVPGGRPVRVTGGAMIDGVLVGTAERPVHIEIA